ncbi:MAG: DNA-processing protein DprA [Clostridia bacterium]|nr:DNA-processing protein DprA [Clostridia bacterium]
MGNMEIKEISIIDDEYPLRLKNIKDAPEKLYVIGDEKLLKSAGIAIIGSREYSDYGKEYALKFAEELAEQNLTIISGMAVRNRYICT